MDKAMASMGEWSYARVLRAGVSCGAALALLACGGGGGGGGGAPSVPAATGLVITSANAPAVAAEAVETSTSTDAASAAGQFVTGVQVDAGSGGGHPQLLAGAARTLLARPRTTGPVAAGAVVSEACSGGGTVTVDANTSGASFLVAGDSLSIRASNCVESVDGTTMVLNGSMSIAITSGSYDPNSLVYPKSVTMRIVSSNFSAGVSGGATEVFDGDLTLALTENSATTGSLTATAASLTSSTGSHRITLSDYRLQAAQTSTGSTLSVTTNVVTNNARLGSTPVRYSLATETPVAVSSSGAVTAGSIRVSGTQSSMLLLVTATDTFSLQVDTNGDGTADSTRAVTLADLRALN
jgi:hypothetical protein